MWGAVWGRIAGHYLRTWFVFDFISTIPVAYFQLAVEGACVPNTTADVIGAIAV